MIFFTSGGDIETGVDEAVEWEHISSLNRFDTFTVMCLYTAVTNVEAGRAS